MTPADQLLTVKEYAELTRVHIQTVYLAIRRGRLPVVRPTGGEAIRIRVPRARITRLKHAE